MKLQKVALAALVLTGITFTSCRETETKETTVIKEVKVETPEREGILERAAKKADDKINEEINEEIDKIGDDN